VCFLIFEDFDANRLRSDISQSYDEQDVDSLGLVLQSPEESTAAFESSQQHNKQSVDLLELVLQSTEENSVTLEPVQQYNKQEEYPLRSTTAYLQLFFGKWEITNYLIPSSGQLPRSYSKFDENGSYAGWDLNRINRIIGEEIFFEEDYAEYLGTKHFYAYKPETFSRALLCDEQSIGWYTAKELGIEGNYYSVIYFLLPENCWITGFENIVREVRIDDLFLLYLKDNETIYASDGNIMYQLERVE